MEIGPEATCKPRRHSIHPHWCSSVIADAPMPPWGQAKHAQMLQEHLQVRLKAPAVMEVHLRCYDILLIRSSTLRAPKMSAHMSRRPRERLRVLCKVCVRLYTWCSILTMVVLGVSFQQDINAIIFVTVSHWCFTITNQKKLHYIII